MPVEMLPLDIRTRIALVSCAATRLFRTGPKALAPRRASVSAVDAAMAPTSSPVSPPCAMSSSDPIPSPSTAPCSAGMRPYCRQDDESLAIDGKTMCNALDGHAHQTHILGVVGHQSKTCYTQKK